MDFQPVCARRPIASHDQPPKRNGVGRGCVNDLQTNRGLTRPAAVRSNTVFSNTNVETAVQSNEARMMRFLTASEMSTPGFSSFREKKS